VENVRQEAFLRAFGCDALQGNFYSKPLPRDEFESLFGASKGISSQYPRRLEA
jgi:EAL domain-containing protein (putative c-di-GMP-specific phosphodiesterase class I)